MRLNKIFMSVAMLMCISASAQYVQPMGYKDYSFWLQMNIGNEGAKTTHPSAYLELGKPTGSKKGFLPPRMTTAQRDLIGSPATGLYIFNTTDNEPNYFDGESWRRHISLADTSLFLATKTDLQGINSSLVNVPAEFEEDPGENGFEVFEFAYEGTNKIKKLLSAPGFLIAENDSTLLFFGNRFGVEDALNEEGNQRTFDVNQGRFKFQNAESYSFEAVTPNDDEGNISHDFAIDPTGFVFNSRYYNGGTVESGQSSDTTSSDPLWWAEAHKTTGMQDYRTYFHVTASGAKLFYDFGGDILSPRTPTLPGYRLLARDTITGALVDYTGDMAAGDGFLVNPMTTEGDMIFSSDDSGTPARLGIGSTGQVLTAVAGLPTWVTWLTPTLQDVINSGNQLNKSDTVDQQGFQLNWFGPNHWKDVGVTQITEVDYNSEVSIQTYTPYGDTSISLTQDVINGFEVEATYGSQTHSLQVKGDGIHTSGLVYNNTNSLRNIAVDTLTGKWYTVAPASGSTPAETKVKLTADVGSAASASAQDITGLSFTATANVRYFIKGELLINSIDGNTGGSIGINGPASPAIVSFKVLIPQSSTSIAQGAGSDYSVRGGTSTTVSSWSAITFTGWIQTTTTGTVTLRFSPETATANGWVVKAGSYFTYEPTYTHVP